MHLRVVQSSLLQPDEQLHVLGAKQIPPLAQEVEQSAIVKFNLITFAKYDHN